jgi:UDP-N-acetylmuramoyl-tripeptide--D-alanyl-D-alanine ligase
MEFTMEVRVANEATASQSFTGSNGGVDTATITPTIRRSGVRVRMQSHLTPRGIRLLCDRGGEDLDSVKLAIMALAAVPHAYDHHGWAVLGDINDTGIDPVADHHELGEFCAEHYIDRLVCIGMRAAEIARGALDQGMNEDQVQSFGDSPTALNYLRENVNPGDVMLVKGSKSMNPDGIIAAMFSV